MKCKHLNCVFIEEAVTALYFDFKNGKIVGDGTGFASPNGWYTVQCHDCGYIRRFNMFKYWPKWVKNMYEALQRYSDAKALPVVD